MTVSLLTTKLYFPSPRPALVSRPRLVERLLTGLRGPLTLISAPAGYGKTTLLSEWHARAGSKYPVAWFSIDSGDNDLFRFWGYVTATLETLEEGLTGKVASLLQSPQLPPVEELITVLINNISKYAKDFTLILDDYHTVTVPEIHQSLTYLVDHLPHQMHLVMLTRFDPTLPLARLRARGQLMELRAGDLRFTADEAAEFLNICMGLRLPPEKINDLEQRTEGWIAGLQMAALSLQGKDDVNGFIEAFTGNNRFVLDYLAEEILQQLSGTLRTFLLDTSILERMTASLCEAVTGCENGREILQELERENLFVIPLDDQRHWYRYHNLFATVLHAYLGRLRPESIPVLQRRACDWCAQQGLVEEAIQYALAACDYSRAADLVEANAWPSLNRGNLFDVLKWITALPEEYLADRPALSVAQVWALFISGKEDQMLPLLQRIESRTGQPEGEEEILLRAIGARWRGNAAESLELTERALKRLPQDQILLQGQAWFNSGMLYKDTNVVKAQKAFRQSSAISEARHDVQGALKAMYFEGTMFQLHGALHRSEVVFKHALELARDTPFFNGAGYAHLGMAEITYEKNDLAETTDHLNRAIQLAQDRGMDELHYHAALAMARLHRVQGKWSQAQEMLDQAERLAYQAVQCAQMRFHSFLTIPVLQEQAQQWRVQGKNELILSALDNTPSIESMPLYYHLIMQATLARNLIYQQKYAEAAEILDQALIQVKSAHMAGLSIRLLRAIVYFIGGEIERALSVLGTALDLAEPEGYVRTFLEEGEVVPLLRHAASKGMHPAYVRQILSANAPSDQTSKSRQPLIEPMSERELEILRLVAAGKSNQQIAADLFLAVGTVKRHVSNIFGKMNVQSRTECIARARELDLLH